VPCVRNYCRSLWTAAGADVQTYSASSVIELACAFAPSLTALLVLRALFGLAMGGEWEWAAALAFETCRGRPREFSGILQEATRWGRFWPSAAFALLQRFCPGRAALPWPCLAGAARPWDRLARLFILGATPALMVFYVQSAVEESPVVACRGKDAAGAGGWSGLVWLGWGGG